MAELEPLTIRLEGEDAGYGSTIEGAIDASNEFDTVIQGMADALAQQKRNLSMSAAALADYELRTAGATEGQIEQMRSLAEQSAALDKQQELEKSLAGLTERLSEQAATFGMTANEMILYKAASEGATESQLAQIVALQDSTEQQKRARQEIAQIEQQVAQKMMQGEQVTRSVATATEKYTIEIRNLNELLNAGAITQETYNRALQQTNAQFQSTSSGMAKFASSATSIGTALSIGLTAPLALFGASAVKDFAEEEMAVAKLGASLEMNGQIVSKILPQYQAFAAEIQKTTVHADESVLKLLQVAESMGVTGEKAKRAAKNAIAMQAAFGMSAQGAIRLTSRLEEGQVGMLTRYIPALKGVKDHAEQVRIAQEHLAKGFNLAEAEAKTFTGALEQSKNALSEAKEIIGKVLSADMLRNAKWVKQAAEWFAELSPAVQTTAVYAGFALAVMGPLLLVVGGTIAAVNQLTIAYLAANAAVIKYTTTKVAETAATMAATKATQANAAALGGEAVASAGKATLAIMALKAALTGLALVGIGAFAYTMYQSSKYVTDFNDLLSDTQRAAARTSAAMTRETGKILAGADSKTVRDTGTKEEYLQKELKKAEEQAKAFSNQIIIAKKNVEQWKDATGGQAGHVFQMAKAGLIDMENKLEIVTERATLLKEKLEEMAPKEVVADTEGIEKLTKHLQDQIDTFGMSESALIAYKMNALHASEEAIAFAYGLAQQHEKQKEAAESLKELAKKQEDLKNDTQSLTDKLQSQIDAFGKTGAAAEIAALKKRAAGNADLQAKLTAAEALDAELEGLKKKEKMQEKANRLVEKHKSPQQKMKEEQDELRDMFNNSMLTVDEYNMALKDLEKQMQKDHTVHLGVKADAIDAGSIAAFDRVQEFLAATGQTKTITPDKPASILSTEGVSYDPALDKEIAAKEAKDPAYASEHTDLLGSIDEHMARMIEIEESRSDSFSSVDFEAANL